MATLSWSVDVAEDRRGDRLYCAGAEPFDRAEANQRHHAPGETAKYGADDEQRGPGKEHALAAEHVGEAAVDGDADGLCQQKNGEHPTEQVESAEVAHNCG